jgi:hypothetical protein
MLLIRAYLPSVVRRWQRHPRGTRDSSNGKGQSISFHGGKRKRPVQTCQLQDCVVKWSCQCCNDQQLKRPASSSPELCHVSMRASASKSEAGAHIGALRGCYRGIIMWKHFRVGNMSRAAVQVATIIGVIKHGQRNCSDRPSNDAHSFLDKKDSNLQLP